MVWGFPRSPLTSRFQGQLSGGGPSPSGRKIILTLLEQSKATNYFIKVINRGAFISAPVLLNLLNKLGKRDKMRGLQSILSFFCNGFDKLNNTRAQMLDSIYHMTLKFIKNGVFAMKTSRFCNLLLYIIMDITTLRY